jgi:glutathionylspermidine synthase
MERITLEPRNDWRRHAETLGFAFHTIDGKPYWDETAAYVFTAAEIDAIEDATAELERLVVQAVDKVVRENLFAPFGLDEYAARLARESWQRRDRNIYGRFDLSVRPGEPPKLLEYNADTPTALFEASVVQWEWLQTLFPGDDQFNSIHEKLIEAWPRMAIDGLLHFTCVRDHAEDRGTVDYLRDTAIQAGLATEFLHIDELGWDGARFVDLAGQPVTTLFKLYPWEWLVREEFGRNLGPSGVRMIEPAWKMLVSNKAILALLWHMFPDHPNLLAAFLEPGKIPGRVVAKPLLGREGSDIVVLKPGDPPPRAGEYGQEGFVYQRYWPLPEFDGRYPVVGSWVVASQPAGIGIREDPQAITTNTSCFVPHLFR